MSPNRYTKEKQKLAALLLLTILLALPDCRLPLGADGGRDFRQDMRDFVQAISASARQGDPDFIVIIQNGHEVLTRNGEADGEPVAPFVEAIDAVARESLFYGFDTDNLPTPEEERDYMLSFTEMARKSRLQVLVTDYCVTRSFVDTSYAWNAARGYLSFAADHRGLDNIPAYPAAPYNVNAADVTSISAAKNFLYLIDPGNFPGKNVFLEVVRQTSYDVVLIDLFYDYQPLSPADIASLKRKAGGGERLIIAYMSIGEAEDYRYYWEPEWIVDPPAWLARENPDWPGNYKVRYWDENWQAIIYGNEESYLQRLLDAGFDGVYLDIIDAFHYFEGSASP